MVITEQEILAAIKEAEQEQKEARQLVAYHKKAVVDSESLLIAANLRFEKLTEQLRVHRETTPHYEETPRDTEIERFRALLPNLMEKLDKIEKSKTILSDYVEGKQKGIDDERDDS